MRRLMRSRAPGDFRGCAKGPTKRSEPCKHRVASRRSAPATPPLTAGAKARRDGMVLRELKIERARWGANVGKFTGSATFDDERGEVSLNLTQEHVDAIFKVCADGIIEVAKLAARDMTCAVIEQAKPELTLPVPQTKKAGLFRKS